MNSLAKTVYSHLPVVLQNAGISLYGIAYRRERFGPAFPPTCSAFLERDRWPEDRMRRFLDSRLREVLAHAFEAPHYAEAWTGAGLSRADLGAMTVTSLPRLPVLKKAALRRDPMSFVPPRARRGRLLHYHSSGSTGTPISAYCTAADQQRFAAAREVRSYSWASTSIRKPRAMIGGQPIVPRGTARPPYYRYNAAERQVYLSAYHLGPATVANYVEAFDRHRPQLVTGYAFSQFLLARLMLEQGLTFRVPPTSAITSSERLTLVMRETIARAWQCRAYQEYGSVENCGLATECEQGRLHAQLDFGIIEIVDDDGQPCPPGREGRLLCTGLLNETQILVRYEIGDIGAWSGAPCPCGRTHLPVLEEVLGRIEDVAVGPDGRELVRFHGLFIDLPFVQEGQVIQEELDRFVVRVVADDGFGENEVRQIRSRCQARVGRVRVDVERVQELERTASGKLRAVISRVRGASGNAPAQREDA